MPTGHSIAPAGFTVSAIIKQVLKADPVRFVQIGSNDGKTGDPIFGTSSLNSQWSGILIEPVPYLFEKLKRNYGNSPRFLFENVAVGNSSGTAPFYFISPQAKHELENLPVRYDQIGSFDKNHLHKHFGGVLDAYIQTIDVRVCTLQEVLARHSWSTIDLLHTDAEGHDWEILGSVDLDHLAAKLVIFEHKHLLPDAKFDAISKMIDGGYRTIELANDICAVRF